MLYFLSLKVTFRLGGVGTWHCGTGLRRVSLQDPLLKIPPELFTPDSYQLQVSLQRLLPSCFSQVKREILMGQGAALEDFEDSRLQYRLWETSETLCSVLGLEVKKRGVFLCMVSLGMRQELNKLKFL